MIKKPVPRNVWDSDEILQHYGASVLYSLNSSADFSDIASLKLSVSLDLRSLPIGQHYVCFNSNNMPALFKLFPALRSDHALKKPPQSQRKAQPALDCSPHDDWCLWLNGPSLKSLSPSSDSSPWLPAPSSDLSAFDSAATVLVASRFSPVAESKRKPDPLPSQSASASFQPSLSTPTRTRRPRTMLTANRVTRSRTYAAAVKHGLPAVAATTTTASVLHKLSSFLPRFRFR